MVRGRRFALMLPVISFGCFIALSSRAATELDPILEGLRWGETSAALAQHFGPRALRVDPPIAFGDSYVDVALRDQKLGGYDFSVLFQMDRQSGGLKRVMLERQRHGANPRVFRAVLAALQRDYGAPQHNCRAAANRTNGYQANGASVWTVDGTVIRAVFRNTTLEASGGCAAASPCGLTGQLYVQITPLSADGAACP